MDIKILLKAIPFELERAIAKNINTRFKRRPSSEPFLSGDTFRAFADVLYDETQRCKPEDIRENDIVFVKTDLLNDFFDKILENINTPIVLITHNSDYTIDKACLHILEHKNVKHWFTQNCALAHSKITPLPIGLENAFIYNAGCLKDFKKLSSQSTNSKQTKIVVAFTMGTNADARFECYRSLWRKPITKEFPGNLTCRQYRQELLKYQFVASPEGNGLDCHRTWEAMYLGVVPILKRNSMTDFFKSLNLPLWIIDSWDEVSSCTKEDLTVKYNDIILKTSSEAAYFDYWKKEILKKKY